MVLFAPIRQIHRRYGLDTSDARAATLACLRRHRILYLAAPLAAGAMACFVAWWTFGVLLMLLDPLRIELFPDASTAIGVPLYLLLGLALCLTAALTMFTIARRGLVLLELAEIAAAGECLRCRYSLRGLNPDAGRVHCPECGLGNPTPPAPSAYSSGSPSTPSSPDA